MVLSQTQEIHRQPPEPQKLAVVDFDATMACIKNHIIFKNFKNYLFIYFFFVDKILHYKGEHTKACTVLTQALEVGLDKTK